MDPQILSVLISAAALLVSIVSCIVVYRVQRTQARVHERLYALEAARERGRLRESRMARLTAKIIRYGSECRVAIVNEGSGPSRHIRTLLDALPLLEHPLVPTGQGEVTELGPSAEVEYILATASGNPNTATLEISWSDDSGEPGAWKSQLSLY